MVRAQPTSGPARLAVIDPKLRQRDRLPAEELYKILGYLQNFAVRPPIGVVLIYTTETEPIGPDVFGDGSGGVLISATLNPAAPAAASATLRIVVDTLLGLIDYKVLAGTGAGAAAADDVTDDERAEAVVESVRASVLAWGQGHLDKIASSRERIGSLITDTRWSGLHDDVQVMMATADLVGHDLDANADFSGPVIGMCAAVEHILHACAIWPVVAAVPAWQKQVRTLGAALDAVDFACRSGGSPLHRALRAHLNSTGIDVATVASLLPLWRRMNSTYRVPAAHREILTKAQWQQLYGLLMGSDHLFVRTLEAHRT